MPRSPKISELARDVAQDVLEGKLSLQHVVGLSDGEMAALEQLGGQLRRNGSPHDALEIFGLLASLAPYTARYWLAIAELKQALGDPATAVACYELVALLDRRRPGHLASEATCLRAMGRADLASELLERVTPS
ncbi:MAG: hypothetical protein IT371_15175 [Deltaproteobacteria bacterium]|nr:hypothetical protein [Deltaproteobacteria bacterium]